MERIIIIDHEMHRAFIEDLDEDILNEKYNGNEEDYIKDNYTLPGEWSWDFVTCIEYFPNEFDDCIEIEPSDLL